MNYNIIRKVQQSCRMFQGIDLIKANQGQGQNNVTTRGRGNKLKNSENQLTVMLLLVTTLFLILMIPSYIRFLYLPFVIGDTPAKYAFLAFFFYLSHKLYTTNSGINLFLYCISGQKFRNDLKEILGFCRRSKLNKERPQTSITEISNFSQY